MVSINGVFVLFSAICVAQSAKILGIFPMAYYSQWYQGHRLLTELAEKGHEITMISLFKDKEPIKNYKLIHVPETDFGDTTSMFVKNDFYDVSVFERILWVAKLCSTACKKMMENPQVQALIKSDEHFDVIITQEFFIESIRGFQHRFKAPVVGVNPLGATFWANEIMANPSFPSFIPEVMTKFNKRMTFFERLVNFVVAVYTRLLYHLYILPNQNELMHQHFPDAPYITDLLYNTSLMLINSHVSTNQLVPLLPNMIEVGGFHIPPQKELPNDIKSYLDNAKNGVIYFSLGSFFKSANLPNQTKAEILDVFGSLKENVLWKFEDDTIESLPNNVMIRKWLPQQDILAHPNVKLFITHGGLLSTIETTFYGKPIIGIPLFGDQVVNMVTAVRNGIGISISYPELSKETLSKAIKEMLINPQYKKNIEERSKLMKDQPMKPMERAIYWVEYVIRHKGAPHYHSIATELTWYQYICLDVILFFLIQFYLIYFTIKIVIRLLFKSRSNVSLKKKKD